MAITFVASPGGLFNRIGRFGKLADRTRGHQANLLADFASLMAQYDTSRPSVDGVPSLDKQTRLSVSAFLSTLTLAGQKTILDMVKADRPDQAHTLGEALAEIVRQMRAGVVSVKKCTVAASAAALSTNSGNGAVVVTAKRGDGLDQELIIPETAYLVCVADSQTGGATAGQELFQYTGEVAAQSVWDDEYPIGSGATTTTTAVDASVDGTAGTTFGNLLTNGDFEAFTANLPDHWSALVGVAGTNFLKSTTQFYDGAASLQIVGGATLTSLAQTFGLTAGTPAAPLPSTSYAVNFWAKVDVVPAGGVLTVDLVDGTNAVINDDQGVANSFTVALTGLTTSFAAKGGVFRLPKLLPATIKLRVRISTALSGGSNLFLDRIGMGRVTGLYAGGPAVCVFSGNTHFVGADGWTLTTTNDFGGASNLSTFQWLFDRLFGMRGLGLLLPSNAVPSVSDTLITS